MDSKQKWQSRRWLIAVWAILCVTFMLIYGLIFAPTILWIPTVINFFVALILAYLGSETVTKNTFLKSKSALDTNNKHVGDEL